MVDASGQPSCQQVDVQRTIDAASSGDIIAIPAGDCAWGADRTYLSVNKAITLQGAGQGQTIITLSDTGGIWTNAVIRISAAATVKSMTINGSSANPVAAFSTGAVNGWRITDIDFNGGNGAGYFVYVGNVYGLIDNNNISTGAFAELIFARGPSNSWQTADSIGGENNLFIENNIFNGPGQVADCNSNSRCVIRYNIINGAMKADGHGLASNSPPRGVRHMEIYNNLWTYSSGTGSWRAMEIRGGTGRIFNNIIQSTVLGGSLGLTDYCYTSNGFGNCGGETDHCNCPGNYPVTDQIGVGIDPKSAGSEPYYLWNNTKGGSPVAITWSSTSVCAAVCGVSFTLPDVIQSGVDYFMSDTKDPPAGMPVYNTYACPHPLAGLTGRCDSDISGISGYNVNISDATPPAPPSGLTVN